MEKKVYRINDIDDYLDRLTIRQAELLIEHCNKFQIAPDICAWYNNMEDFYSDWCDPKIVGLTRTDARERLEDGKDEGEFKIFSNGEIVRLVI